ncbi:MAG: hypothetical protein AB1758_16805, partial [Candidatus Eremiobacterota bacterium]
MTGALLAEGVEMARGEFTLDMVQARAKMARYQLPDPHAYVLELVQGAVLRGASRIEFRIAFSDLRMLVDGPLYSEDELRGAEAALLESGGDARLQSVRQLGVGLTAALALRPRFVRVDSGRFRLELRPGKPSRVASIAPVARTRLHVAGRLRPLDLFRSLLGQATEEQILRRQCAHCPVPILVNDRRITGQKQFVDVARVDLEADGVQGVGGFRNPEPEGLSLMKDGVLMETVRLEAGPLPYRALVSGRDLMENVSQTAVVRDAAYEAVRQVALDGRSRSVEKLCREGLDRHAWLHQQMLQELLSVKSLELLEQGPREEYPRCLATVDLFSRATGNGPPVSFERILQIIAETGFLPYASERHPELELEGLPFVLLTWAVPMEELLKLISHRARNVTRRIHNQLLRELNRKQFLTRVALPVVKHRVKRAVRGGEVGLGPFNRPARIRFLKDGCVLAELLPPVPLWGLEAAVAGDFTPSETFD